MAKKSSSKPSAVLGYNDKRVKSQRKKDRSFKIRSVFGIVTLSLAAVALVALVAFSFADQQYNPVLNASMTYITNDSGAKSEVQIETSKANQIMKRRQPTISYKFSDSALAGKAGVTYQCRDNMIANPTAWFACSANYQQGFATGKVIDYHINAPGTDATKAVKNSFEIRSLLNGTVLAGSTKKFEWIYMPDVHEVRAKVDGVNLSKDLRVVLPSASQVRVAWDDADGATSFKCYIRTLQFVAATSSTQSSYRVLSEVLAKDICRSTEILTLPSAVGLYDVRVQASYPPDPSIANSSNLPEKYGRAGNTIMTRKIQRTATSTYFADQDPTRLPVVKSVSVTGFDRKDMSINGVLKTELWFNNTRQIKVSFTPASTSAPGVKYGCQLWDNVHSVAVYGTNDCNPAGTTLTLPATESGASGTAQYQVRIITYSTQAGYLENAMIDPTVVSGPVVKKSQM